MFKKISILTICGILFFSTLCYSDIEPYKQKIQNGEIDWAGGIIKVKGEGLVSEDIRGPRAKLMAKRAAVVDAYRNLAEIVNGVQVDSETNVENFVLKSDVVKTKVKGFIEGAQITYEKFLDDGTYEVELTAYLFGDGSLGTVILEEQENVLSEEAPAVSVKESFAKEEIKQKPPKEEFAKKESAKENIYTGLVIDATNIKGLQACLLPNIFDEEKNIVYDDRFVNKDALSKDEYATYFEIEKDAELKDTELLEDEDLIQEVGKNPLVVKAVSKVKKDDPYNIMISKSDADKINAERAYYDFLKNAKVAIIVGSE